MDPFPQAQDDASSSLSNAQQLFDSWLRIKSTAHPSSEELSYAEAELKALISTLDADVSDLEEAVQAVERRGAAAFGLSEGQVRERRRFVDGVREALDDIRMAMKRGRPLSVHSADILNSVRRGSFRSGSPSPDLEASTSHAAGYDQQQQQYIMEEQDSVLTSLGSVVGTLRSQAMSVGSEVIDQVSMLGQLDQDVDRSQGKLDAAQKKMNMFLRETRSSKSSCCILILIIVLCILLAVAFAL